MKRAADSPPPGLLEGGSDALDRSSPDNRSEPLEKDPDCKPAKRARGEADSPSKHADEPQSDAKAAAQPQSEDAESKTESASSANQSPRDDLTQGLIEAAAAARSSVPADDPPRMGSREFPAQLMNALQRNVAPDALWFLEGGEAIGMNTSLIVDKVLNEHFRGMKFNSLIRNLNRWGFRRISHASLKGKERGYHHLLFQRDKPELVHRMKRDSNAKEVMRQLDLADGKIKESSATEKVKASKRATTTSSTNPAPSAATASQQKVPPSGAAKKQAGAPDPPARDSSSSNQAGTVQPPLIDVRQHQLMQSLAAHQQGDWQRNQMFANFDSMQSQNWATLGANWTAPSSAVSAQAYESLRRQQHLNFLQASGSVQAPAPSRTGRDPPSSQNGKSDESNEQGP